MQNAGSIRAHRIPLVIEVSLRETSTAGSKDIEEHLRQYLSGRAIPHADAAIPIDPQADPFLAGNIDEVRVCDTEFYTGIPVGCKLMDWQVDLQIYVFQASDEGPADADESSEEATPSFSEWQLPATAFNTLWDSLIYEEGIKQRLLQYASTTLLFGQQKVDPHLVAFNRTVLLHGPPGSGKTSLSKALAQKLAIRFGSRYSHSQLIEVNAHSLFSKWFSESGKLVTALFARIREAVEDEDSLVFVLVDEVESLAAARQAAISGSEPADAVRAVNALLTALDSLKTFSNVMVLTTSNLTAAIDIAFVDRADIKAYLGPPDLRARYSILRSCILELQRCSVISHPHADLPCYQDLRPVALEASAHDVAIKADGEQLNERESSLWGQQLMQIAAACQGSSGRTLRKLPFLAHVLLRAQARDIHVATTELGPFLRALLQAVHEESKDRQQMIAAQPCI